MSADLATVRRMLAAWEALDLDGILATLTPDARYHNVPMPVLEGHDAIRLWIGGFLKDVTRFKVETYAESDAGEGLVFNERADIIGYANGKTASIRIAGVFRFRDGLICDWRDYFDLAEFTNQLK
ncbi:MAG: limonene-1,2-epoxide hydrolase family protein [Sphingobium sp.]